MTFFKNLDELSDITDITFNDRGRLGPLDKASQRIMRGKSEFTPAQREMFAAYVSGLNACSFCYGSHKTVASNFGISEQVIEQLLMDVDSAGVQDNLKPIFKYLKKLTLTPSKIIKDDALMVFNAGWNEEALHEAIIVGCLFNFYNRLLDGHGVKGNHAIYQFGANHLYKNGYGVPWFIALIKKSIKKSNRKKIEQLKSE